MEPLVSEADTETCRPLPLIYHIEHWRLDLRFRFPLGTLRMHEMYAEAPNGSRVGSAVHPRKSPRSGGQTAKAQEIFSRWIMDFLACAGGGVTCGFSSSALRAKTRVC